MSKRTAIVLFTRDLRMHDNPTLSAATDDADLVVPLFVFDEALVSSCSMAPNRAEFLVASLHDLDESLRQRGAPGLVVRRGNPAAEVTAIAEQVGAASVHVSGDWSSHARHRHQQLTEALGSRDVELVVHDETVPVVAPGVVVPQGKDHFAVFTPYHRRWADRPRRPVLEPPRRLASPTIDTGRLPAATTLCAGERAVHLPQGGEGAGRRRMQGWLRSSVTDYDDNHDDLAGDDTSRLSPYLHLGCVSPVELIALAGRSRGAQALVRQLAWRDFHLQVLAARPDAARVDYRSQGDRWRDDPEALQAWKDGRTGYPIVDAAMRQLRDEGWMHNRARLVVGSFLAKTLHIDWREGARHFMHHLVDGDVSNNQLNWQWVAGTGTDSRPQRVLNPLRQAERFDPQGDYVRRHLRELADVDGPVVHTPWKLPHDVRHSLDYPERIVDLDEGRRRFLEARK